MKKTLALLSIVLMTASCNSKSEEPVIEEAQTRSTEEVGSIENTHEAAHSEQISSEEAADAVKSEAPSRMCAFESDNPLLESDPNAFYSKAMFSPAQGPEAFDVIFEEIANAQDYAYITVYSWKLDGLRKAALKACENGAKVRILMDKRHESRTKETIEELEASGCVEVRKTAKTMHEKFVIVDDRFLVNSSANFSSGAKYKYNESFVFLCDENTVNGPEDDLIEQFKHEFSILWNYGNDTKHDKNGSENITPIYLSDNLQEVLYPPACEGACLYSSSTNFSYIEGEDYKLSLRTVKDSYKVQDQMLAAIDGAKKSLYMSVNYLLLEDVCTAVENAIKRGIDVKVASDNKSAKNWSDCANILSENYGESFRFKFYSFFPNARKAILNHNKFFIVDYDPTLIEEGKDISEDTILVTGSHNISNTAEKKQFDNMIVFKTLAHGNLYRAFYKDFEYVWNLGRDEKEERVEAIIAPFRGHYLIHQFNQDGLVSLTLEELNKMKKELEERAPGILSRETPRKTLEECDYYNPENRKYYTYEKRKFEECNPK